MAVLITGVAGFIGSACADALSSQGQEIVGIDTFDELLYPRAIKERNLAWARRQRHFRFAEIDVTNPVTLARLFTEHPIDRVIHLAALAGVRPSIRSPGRYFDVNATGTSCLLQAATNAGVRKYVIASSSSVYGGNKKVPFSEDDPVVHPISPYAASKCATELLVHAHCHLHQADASLLRFFTVYGPRQRPDMAIHKFMRCIAAGQPIKMFGDGSSSRDYTYISDIVAGTLSALDRAHGYRVYNLGGDRVTRLCDLIAQIASVVGREATIDRVPCQPGDMPVTMADLGRARSELRYDPEVDLTTGLREMWAWMKGEYREGVAVSGATLRRAG
ncbi:MAG: NAD-dependent epimerase/dehydratase family protein [Nannocystaceae bacterium]